MTYTHTCAFDWKSGVIMIVMQLFIITVDTLGFKHSQFLRVKLYS